MKIAKFFAVIFAVVGIVLMIGTPIFCFASANSSVKVLKSPEGAELCSEQLMKLLNEGDLSGAGKLLYGQPDLGVQGTPADAYSALLWEAYLNSISLQYTSRLYLLDAELARDATITVLDVGSVMDGVQSRAKSLLEAKVAEATDMAELYEEGGAFRKELVEQVMTDALQTALKEDGVKETLDVTVKLVFRDGQWWAVPEQAFLKAISGING